MKFPGPSTAAMTAARPNAGPSTVTESRLKRISPKRAHRFSPSRTTSEVHRSTAGLRTRHPPEVLMPRTSGFPRQITGHVHPELRSTRRTCDRAVRVALLVDATVRVLEERQIWGEEALDDARVDLLDVSAPGDDPSQ